MKITKYTEEAKILFIMNCLQKPIDHKAILNLISAMVKSYKNNKATSWLKKKSILTIALEGYSFGAERGQIRGISDHNHIIPLYDYGVGVYDFDMSKVKPMIALSKQESEKHVNEFFKVKGKK